MAANYPVDAITYGNAFSTTGGNTAAGWARASDSSFGRLIMGEAGFTGMAANGGISTPNKALAIAKSLLYLDMWGRSAATGGIWHLGPGELTPAEPDIVLNSSVHCYRMTDRHMERLLGWIEHWLTSPVVQAAFGGVLPLGVFMDDYGLDRRYWRGPAGQAHDDAATIANMNRVWGAMNGRSGWDTGAEAGWNTARVNLLSARLLALQSATGKRILFNGTTPVLDSRQPRMFEGYQRWWTLSEMQGMWRAGDTIVVNGRTITAGGELDWYTLQDGDEEVANGDYGIGDSYSLIMAEAAQQAVLRGLRVIVSGRSGSGWTTNTPTGAAGPHNTVYTNLEDPANLPAG